MAHNPISEIASLLQSTSINHHPDVRYDVNPSTSASTKIPVRVSPSHQPSQHQHRRTSSSTSEIPASALRRPPRNNTLPPLPDLRFEQSYLARIKDCTTWYAVAWITVLDQVLMPLSQGLVYNLGLFGWRAWNGEVQFKGAGVGARVRRWWWGVNNWKLPGAAVRR